MNDDSLANSSVFGRLAPARARFLAQAIQLEEQQPFGMRSAALILTLVLLAGGFAWSAVTHISERAHAPGQVVPEGLNYRVQHLEGGLVRAVHVRNGDPVRTGDLLLEFDHTSYQSELEQIRVRKATLELQSERLASLIEGREPQFAAAGAAYPALAGRQMEIYRAQAASHNGEVRVARSQVAGRQSELELQQNSVKSLEKEVDLLSEHVGIWEQLEGEKLIARTDLLANQSRLAQVQSELGRARDGVAVARSALEEAHRREAEIGTRFLQQLQLEAGSVATELADVSQTLVRLDDRSRRGELRAEIDGIVQGLTVTRSNSVVEPGQIIMELVPVGDRMLVEARVSPADIGHVKIGQAVEVQIDSYDQARFGSVDGLVEQISANTYLDDRSEPYYRSEISLSRTHLGTHAGEFPIIPGMTVVANITTGSKTILEYLLKPLRRGLDDVFSER